VLVDVGAVDDFTDATVKVLFLDGREIGLVRWRNEFYALRNVCPHQSGPVCIGLLRPKLSAVGIDGLRVEEDSPVLSCPWHGWEFEVKTGFSVAGHPYRVGTYPVRVDSGRVKVEVGSTRWKGR